jgi:uncharacterized repeat protein (TIGR03806 family)
MGESRRTGHLDVRVRAQNVLRMRSRSAPAAVAAVMLTLLTALLPRDAATARAESSSPIAPYGLASRVIPKPYLGMPQTADGKIPALLSQTGAFKDTRNLVPGDGLIPYDLVVSFWSDGASKQRWISVPKEKIGFAATGEWTFPAGLVLVKTFELPVDAADPGKKRRLETRLLVRDSSGGVYGVVYKWRPDNSDADLLNSSLTEDIPIKSADGTTHTQTWYYPSRKNCLECHNARAGGVLGVKTRQMNHDFTYPSGVTDNELRTWNHLGLFTPGFAEADLSKFARLAAADDTTRSLEDRARSYLDANCSQCHRPGGTVANFDARYDTPLDQQGIVDGHVLIDERIDRSRVIAPNDIWRSIAFLRVNTVGEIRMPPLARETIDEKGVALLQQWITSLPGRAVVDPPQISPAAGTYNTPVEVSLHVGEPGADIRYTLDGSAPTATDIKYETPIKITGPTVVRARAFKEGLTRSVASEAVFIIGQP